MTYVYLGHGRELLDQQEVLPGCTLSTIAESGVASDLRSVLNLCNLSTVHRNIVTRPKEHYDRLHTLFSGNQFSNTFSHKRMLQEGEYHLKEEGDPYKNLYCDFVFKFDKGNHMYALLRSGLYNIEIPRLKLPILKEDDIYDHVSINIDSRVGLTFGNIKQLYHGCVYPDLDTILSNITLETQNPSMADDIIVPYRVFQAAVHKTVTLNVDGLMERFKGNHYFFVCRTYEHNHHHSFNSVQARRQSSAERGTRRLSRRASPTMLEGSTRKRRDNFKRIIKKIMKDIPHMSGAAYEGLIDIINTRFEIFIEKKGKGLQRHIDFVNDIIKSMNEYKIIKYKNKN